MSTNLQRETGSADQTDSARRRPLDVNRLIAQSFRIYWRRWRLHLAAAVIAQLPGLVPTLVLISLLLDSTLGLLQTRSAEALTPALGLSVAVLLLRAYGTALRLFWRLAGAMLLAGLLVVLGLAAIAAFLALFYLGFLVILQIDLAGDPRFYWFMLALTGLASIVACAVLTDALVKWAVFVQAVIVEGRGPAEALYRSAELVRGNWWRTAGAMALLLLVPLLLMSILSSLSYGLLAPLVTRGMLPERLVNSIGIAVAQVVFSPVPAIGVTVLFYHLRDGASIWSRIDARLRGGA
jgi:hypothetical protein